MSYVRSKRFSNGRIYFYLVESYRDHGKVKQRVLKYYGRQDPRQDPRQGPRQDPTEKGGEWCKRY